MPFQEPEQPLRPDLPSGPPSGSAPDSEATRALMPSGPRAAEGPDTPPSFGSQNPYTTPADPASLEGFPLKDHNRYQALALVGEGGMGVVYKVFDHHLRRVVAVKFLKRLEPEATARFMAEGRAQAQVDHPHVCRVFEVGEAQGHPYLVMQYVNGPTLRDAAHELSVEQKARILQQAAEALHACHRLGIIHRDVKPGNVMLQRDPDGTWQAYVMDFGVARDLALQGTTRTHVMMGTPTYFSPEQALGDGDRVDRRSDVYALGATLYECLCGRPPFVADTTLELLRLIGTEDPVAPGKLVPSLPRDLETIVLKALEKEPAQRYDSARALAEDLQRFLDGDPILARRPTLAYRAGKLLRKNRTLAVVTGISLAVVAAAAGYGVRTALATRARTRLAERLGREVERMEALVFKAESLPLHDVRAEHQNARNRLEELRRELDQEGRWAQGPGRLALGRGYLALGDLDAARRELESAHRADPKDPDTAQALGVALARSYVAELEGLRGRPREERIKELESSLRTPALDLLRHAKGAASEDPAYAEGLLALVEDRPDDALALARQAQQRQPWFHPAWLLEADVLKDQAGRRLSQGDRAGAEATLEEAGRVLAEAHERARSAPEPLESEAQRRLMIFGLKLDRGQAEARDLDWALEPVVRALKADPDSWRALSFESAIRRRWATLLLDRTQDPSEELDRASAAAERALALRPSEAPLWVNWGTLLRNRAEWELSQGRDPIPHLAKAEEALQRGLQQPRLHDFLLDGLGLVHALRAEHDVDHGTDPTPEVKAAVDCFQQAARLRPWVGHAWGEASTWLVQARYQAWTGAAPFEALDAAVRAAEEGLRLNASSYQCMVGLAQARLGRAEALREAGRPFQEELGPTRAVLDRALSLKPDLAEAHLALARLSLLAGDPPAAVEAHLRQGRALNPRNLDLALAAARTELLSTLAAHRPTRPQTLAEIRQVTARRPWDVEGLLIQAALERQAGRAAEARALTARVLALNPALRREMERLGLPPEPVR